MTRILIILLFIVSVNVFSQNIFKEKFEKIKNEIEKNHINLKEIDLVNEKLNETEFQILKILDSNEHDFGNKEIRFISGPAGTTISTKTSFFKSFLNYYSEEHIIVYSIIKLEEKERILSGTDYLVFFWTKTQNPKSKRLLKKIKQTKQT